MLVAGLHHPEKIPYFETLDLIRSQPGALGDVVELNSGVRIVVSHDDDVEVWAGVLSLTESDVESCVL